MRKEPTEDTLVQGSVAIAAGAILFATLFLPWLSGERNAMSGLTQAADQAQLVIPMTIILLAVLVVFGGVAHVSGYQVGIQLATIASAGAFFISVMVIVVTLATASSRTLNLLVGPWVAAGAAIIGIICSKLEKRKRVP